MPPISIYKGEKICYNCGAYYSKEDWHEYHEHYYCSECWNKKRDEFLKNLEAQYKQPKKRKRRFLIF